MVNLTTTGQIFQCIECGKLVSATNGELDISGKLLEYVECSVKLVSTTNGEFDISGQMLECVCCVFMGHVNKADPVDAQYLISLTEPSIFSSCSIGVDIVDEDRQISVLALLPTYDTEPQLV